MEIAGWKRALSAGRPVFPGTGYFDTTVTGEGNGAAIPDQGRLLLESQLKAVRLMVAGTALAESPPSCRASPLVDLPEPAARRLEGGQDATESAAGVDAHQMPKVQHVPITLGRVADDGCLPGVVPARGRFQR